MKKLLLFFPFLWIIQVKAQETKKLPPKDTLPLISIGSGTGINNFCGILGVGASVKLEDKVFIRLGLGIGGWGTKFTGGIKYEFKTSDSWGIGISYSSCSGLKNFKTQLETSTHGVIQKTDVTLDLLRSSTVNLTASYKWLIRRKNTIFIDLGYAVPIESDPYTIKDGSVLTYNGKTVLHAIQPGGVIFGIGFFIGV